MEPKIMTFIHTLSSFFGQNMIQWQKMEGDFTIIHFLFILILILTGITDAVTRKIPDLFPLLIVCCAVCRLVQSPASLGQAAAGLFVLSVPMLFLAQKKGVPGGGDIKLSAACGLFLGADALLTGGLIACVLALITFFLRQIRKSICVRIHFLSAPPVLKRPSTHDAFAFGPYLAAGFILALLTG